MQQYVEAFKFNFLGAIVYPIEILSFVAKKLVALGFLIFFWLVVSKTNSNIFNFRFMVSYFLISQAIGELTMSSSFAFGRSLQKQIRRGQLQNSLLKPVNLLSFSYASFLGSDGVTLIYSTLSLLLGVVTLPPRTPLSILLFLPALLATVVASLGANIFIGAVGFYSPEASSVKNALTHITSILSGGLIPLDYFPPGLRNLVSLTPFPVLTYYPTVILQQGSLDPATFSKLGLSALWATLLLISANIVWKRALKNFDGVGI